MSFDKYERQRRYQEIVDRVAQNIDRSRPLRDLVEEIATQLPDVDQAELKRKQAREILSALTERGTTEPLGQISFFENFLVDYEPLRLLPDNDGNVVEQREASPKFKWLEAQRAKQRAKEERQKVERQMEKADFAAKLADHIGEEAMRYASWFHEQVSNGRLERDLSYELFLRETGNLGE